MTPREIVSMILSYQDDIIKVYDQNIPDYTEKRREFIRKQVGLIENFKKDTLLEFVYWWMPEIHSQDAHSQIRKFETHLLTKQK